MMRAPKLRFPIVDRSDIGRRSDINHDHNDQDLPAPCLNQYCGELAHYQGDYCSEDCASADRTENLTPAPWALRVEGHERYYTSGAFEILIDSRNPQDLEVEKILHAGLLSAYGVTVVL